MADVGSGSRHVARSNAGAALHCRLHCRHHRCSSSRCHVQSRLMCCEAASPHQKTHVAVKIFDEPVLMHAPLMMSPPLNAFCIHASSRSRKSSCHQVERVLVVHCMQRSLSIKWDNVENDFICPSRLMHCSSYIRNHQPTATRAHALTE